MNVSEMSSISSFTVNSFLVKWSVTIIALITRMGELYYVIGLSSTINPIYCTSQILEIESFQGTLMRSDESTFDSLFHNQTSFLT